MRRACERSSRSIPLLASLPLFYLSLSLSLSLPSRAQPARRGPDVHSLCSATVCSNCQPVFTETKTHGFPRVLCILLCGTEVTPESYSSPALWECSTALHIDFSPLTEFSFTASVCLRDRQVACIGLIFFFISFFFRIPPCSPLGCCID